MIYWDTSALVKLYTWESDSETFVELLANSSDPVCSSIVTYVEVLCAAYRKEQAGDLHRGCAAAVAARFAADSKRGSILAVPCGEDVIQRARRIVHTSSRRTRPVMIRSLDAVHVASAWVMGAESIVSTDARLRQVAAWTGLRPWPK